MVGDAFVVAYSWLPASTDPTAWQIRDPDDRRPLVAYCPLVAQLSFFSAESVPPMVTDLGGLLAAQGQVVTSKEGARVSVVVDSLWRAEAIAELMREADLDAEIGRSEEGRPLVRTATVPQLTALAAQWTRGAVKAVPEGWIPGAREQRAWVLASGRVEADGQRYVLGLDPHAPDTHVVLAQSLMRAGVAPTIVGIRGSSPGLRISGRRRLMHLAENIGRPPEDPDARRNWPHI
ncbi:hypothetical protein M2284_005139 [Rhodococcus sp. LBL1]|uniref:Uncharacterized protein n=1 Tax=Prescottella agglutinans TaxID=1644129 RepID=A0ABT6MKK4_9NOCA|nr:hypothetical protein [Prescottella agglutinans]MDH6680903.1 hypothetical protein [Rhodococcus sp. LBL1]MDH6686207.1 hypothetical protein [Rhodococcus sp. LBL2]